MQPSLELQINKDEIDKFYVAGNLIVTNNSYIFSAVVGRKAKKDKNDTDTQVYKINKDNSQ